MVFSIAWTLALGLFVSSGCAVEPPRPRLVLLYATCTLNRSFLHPYDSAVDFTPALARWATEALVFERHQTESGQSGIAYASIFAGAQAPVHGVYRHPSVLADELELVGETFATAGYDVHAWLGHPMASGKLNYDQGAPTGQSYERALTADDPDFRSVIQRLATDPAYRAFLVTDFTVTHGPYRSDQLDAFCQRYPLRCRIRAHADFERLVRLYHQHHLELSWDLPTARRELGLDSDDLVRLDAVIRLLYRSRVFELDRLFGDLMEVLAQAGLLEDGLVAFTADHGEIHRRRGALFSWTHGYQLAPEVLQVPLLISGPSAGVRSGRYPGVTRSIDVAPTLAGLAGLDPPATSTGVDLASAVRGNGPPPNLRAFSHTALFAPQAWKRYQAYRHLARIVPGTDPSLMWVAMREGDQITKLVRRPKGDWQPQTFDLAADPRELSDQYAAGDPAHAAAVRDLRSYKAHLLLAHAQRRGGRVDLGAEREEELLRALGYIQ